MLMILQKGENKVRPSFIYDKKPCKSNHEKISVKTKCFKSNTA